MTILLVRTTTYLMLDSVVLGDNFLERTYFVDVTCEEGLGIVELGLELGENWCGVMWIARLIQGGSWVVAGPTEGNEDGLGGKLAGCSNCLDNI
jgi:hypothetical protein